MLKLLASMFRRNPPPPGDDLACYHPGERVIYSYFDGEKTVGADPAVLHTRVMDVGPDLDVDIQLSQSPSKDAKLGHQQMLKKIRGIFNVKPWEEGGLTETETVNLLNHFLAFCGWVKKNTSGPATSPGTTSHSSASPSGPGGPADPATRSSSGSASTASDSRTGGRTSSPTESPSAPDSPPPEMGSSAT